MKTQEMQMTLHKVFNHWKLETQGCKICLDKRQCGLETCESCKNQVCEFCYENIQEKNNKCPFCRKSYPKPIPKDNEFKLTLRVVLEALDNRCRSVPREYFNIKQAYTEKWYETYMDNRENDLNETIEKFINEVENEAMPNDVINLVHDKVNRAVRNMIILLHNNKSITRTSPDEWKDERFDILDTIQYLIRMLEEDNAFKIVSGGCLSIMYRLRNKFIKIDKHFKACWDSYELYDPAESKKNRKHLTWGAYTQNRALELYDDWMDDDEDFYMNYVYTPLYDRKKYVIQKV